MKFCSILLFASFYPLLAQSRLTIALPERTRLLVDQRVDLVVEARNLTSGTLRVTANGVDITERFTAPKTADLDCDARPDLVWRADLVSFPAPGWVRLEASLAGGQVRETKDIVVQPFDRPEKLRNVIYYIGDAMTEAYRDAGRIVSRSVETAPGISGLREGFYDRLMEMDQMPVSGMAIAHGADKIIPDSANSATALAMGNKTFDGAISVFGDGTDCAWFWSGADSSNLAMALDNPRVETLAEYLKRKYGYRVGLVSTAAVTDATLAAFASHVGERDASFEIARQYLENPLLGGTPGVDVLMGGGKESWDADVRADGRDLVAEARAKGFRYVETATELRALGSGVTKLLGHFRRASPVSTHASRIRPSSTAHMLVAYDKLRLTRPGSEPLPSFGDWTDQPFLEEMTQKAIEILAGPDGRQPFFLMVEGASIDKQGHSGHAAGAIWDVIELDHAVGVGRNWARPRRPADTLLLVAADHGQTITVLGVHEISDADLTDRTSNLGMSVASPVGTHSTAVYRDVNTNVRPMLPYGSSGSGRTGPPAEVYGGIYAREGFPDYIDADGDGYPENRQVGNKGRVRISVGFRTGDHAGVALPITAEGPGAFLFTGYMDQTDIPLKIAAVLGSDTSDADKLLSAVLANPRYPRTPGK